MFERYFYHSFPRRAKKDIKRGMDILRSILTNGLLLTPEKTKFSVWLESLDINKFFNDNPVEDPHFTKSGVVPFFTEEQIRVCFTELPPPEIDSTERKLTTHADIFGRFALEFNADSIRHLGALPVTYLPMSFSDSNNHTVGFGLLFELLSIRGQLQREEIRYSDPNWSLLYPPSLTKYEEMDWEDREMDSLTGNMVSLEQKLELKHQALIRSIAAIEHLLSLCYPTERTPEDEAMRYFQQREWRITPHLLPKTYLKPLNPAQENDLLITDNEFFGRTWSEETPLQKHERVVDKCIYYQGTSTKHVFNFVRRVFAPPECVNEVRQMIGDAGFKIDVVALE